MFKSEFGGDVVMGCRFQPKLSNPQDLLKVTWHWMSSTSSREVYRMDDRMEVSASQDPAYRGRVTLLTEELKDGWAKLKVNTVSEMFMTHWRQVMGNSYVVFPQSDVVNPWK